MLAACVLVGLALRLAAFPRGNEVRDGDELGYVSGGFLLWEGMAPGFQFAPAGPLTWSTWTYAAIATVHATLHPAGAIRSLSRPVRLLFAVEQGLFDAYADLRTPCRLLAALTIAIALVAIGAAFDLGRRFAGVQGACLCGGLAAAFPTFVEFSGVARPYADAWSYALVAIACACAARRGVRVLGSALFMALAIGSRIDMLLIAPLVVWVLLFGPAGETIRHVTRSRELLAWTLVTVAGTSFVSPWFVTGLLGNLRTIYTVRLLSAGTDAKASAGALAFGEGMAAPIAVIVVGLGLQMRRSPRRTAALLVYLSLLFVSVAHGTAFGLRHQGAALVALVALAPLGLRAFEGVGPRLRSAVLVATLAGPLAQSLHRVMELQRASVTDEATAWIEQHLAPGTQLYWAVPALRPPLPTRASAEALWSEVADPFAFRRKLEAAFHQHGFATDGMPIALSEAHMTQERGNRRRWFILGSALDTKRPRYNVRPVSDGSPFDLHLGQAAAELPRTGGALVTDRRFSELGKPSAAWTAPNGHGIFIYVVAPNS